MNSEAELLAMIHTKRMRCNIYPWEDRSDQRTFSFYSLMVPMTAGRNCSLLAELQTFAPTAPSIGKLCNCNAAVSSCEVSWTEGALVFDVVRSTTPCVCT